MAIQFKKNRIVFHEVVGVEEAESLLEAMQGNPSSKVDLAACTHLHTASLQVLMAGRPAIVSWPRDAELRAWIETALGARS